MSGMGSSNMQISNQTPVNLTGGPLSYRYRFHEIHIHYGLHDQFGSEHSVEGYTFPAEVSESYDLQTTPVGKVNDNSVLFKINSRTPPKYTQLKK